MLSVFKKFVPIPTPLEEEKRYHIDPQTFSKEISGRGLGVVVASNPRNPTGQLIEGDELRQLVEIGRERHATLVMDEFYSAYIYSHPEEQNGRCVSISEFVNDVNTDPVIIIDGLTKNFRLPGWRICWVVGPKPVVSSMQSAGSFLEGGANHPLQLASIPFLDPVRYTTEAAALQTHFRAKRDFVLRRLEEIGFGVHVKPDATFYVWLDLKTLKHPIDAGLVFFEEFPGIFFDINPSNRRELFESPCHHFVRLSFGPPLEELARGLDSIERVVKKFGFKSTATSSVHHLRPPTPSPSPRLSPSPVPTFLVSPTPAPTLASEYQPSPTPEPVALQPLQTFQLASPPPPPPPVPASSKVRREWPGHFGRVIKKFGFKNLRK
ncbi:pyridoxal phosphate-dependent transferase [Jimgerdemannia flammicorona]|uniref:Pyridoxal phosphate-dependent transferase n=1 Tax=Jimgerdemannia flammicorona TaxID=994334 RepID=A0A433C9Z3_9FUNG|nr:pyridoxal phosphate-dependent transferase [Jimgerdemannia flammicorona]